MDRLFCVLILEYSFQITFAKSILIKRHSPTCVARRWESTTYINLVIARSFSDVATDAAERVQRTSLLVLYRAARRKSLECVLIFRCYHIKKLKFLFSTFCRRKGGAKTAR